MSRLLLPFAANDISDVAKRLRAELGERPKRPSHVEMLNMLARSAGYRNFQHFRADAAARARLEAPPAEAPLARVDHAKIARLLRLFGAKGRLSRWPKKKSQQALCLWVIWSRIPPRRVFTEREISEFLGAEHDFGDHALLRRELVSYGLVSRPIDGSAYQRVEVQPPPEALALIRAVGRRSGTDRRPA